MDEESSVDTARFAFRKREQRFVLTKASIGYLVLAIVLDAACLAVVWPIVGPLVRWYIEVFRAATSGSGPTPPPVGPFLSFAPWVLLFALLGGVLYAAYEAACLRWLVRGESGGGVLGLRLSGDTWRVFATYWVWCGLLIGCWIPIIAFYVGIRALMEVAGPLRVLVLLIAALAPLAIGAALIFFTVRLAPAAAASVARRRFAFFDAWAATRGTFWRLLGAFFLVGVGYLVLAWLTGKIIEIPMQQKMALVMAGMTNGGDVERILSSLRQEFVTPLFITIAATYYVLTLILSCVARVTFFGINASALTPSPVKPSA
jgi:hypothetical protein